jgi:AcrR family transcriptional regulator
VRPRRATASWRPLFGSSRRMGYAAWAGRRDRGVGGAKATLYKHFRRKDDLILAYLDKVDLAWRAQLEAASEAAASSRGSRRRDTARVDEPDLMTVHLDVRHARWPLESRARRPRDPRRLGVPSCGGHHIRTSWIESSPTARSTTSCTACAHRRWPQGRPREPRPEAPVQGQMAGQLGTIGASPQPDRALVSDRQP